MGMANILQHRYLDIADDLEEIGSLVYHTDPYIYPAFFGDETTARYVISEAIRRGMFCYKPENIFCAFDGTKPVAMICTISASSCQWNHQMWKELFVISGMEIPSGFEDVSLRYFLPISEEDFADAVYVLALCVSPDLRGKGIGTECLRNFCALHSGEIIILDTLCENQMAISLYRSGGFVEQKRYLGYSLNDPHPECVRRVKKGQ